MFHPNGNILKLYITGAVLLPASHCKMNPLWATHNIATLGAGLTHGFHANSFTLYCLCHPHAISSSVPLPLTLCLALFHFSTLCLSAKLLW